MEWISVEDRCPANHSQQVLCLLRNGKYSVLLWYDFAFYMKYGDSNKPTHWMPLPSAPKGANQ